MKLIYLFKNHIKRILLLSFIIGVFSVFFVHFVYLPLFVDKVKNAFSDPNDRNHRKSPSPESIQLFNHLYSVDIHADTLLWSRNILKKTDRGHVDVPRLKKGNFALQVFSVVTQTPRGINYLRNDMRQGDSLLALSVFSFWPLPTWIHLDQRAFYQANQLHQMIAGSDGYMHLLKTPREIVKHFESLTKQHEKLGVVLALEGSQAVGGELQMEKTMDDLVNLGFLIFSPAHLTDNQLSGSSTGNQKRGLTDLGKSWLEILDRKNLILDLAHASPQTLKDVLLWRTENSSRLKILVSHTGLQGVCSVARNLFDHEVQALISHGALIGIGLWDEIHCGGGIDPLIKSLNYARKNFGIQHFSLGSDWDGYVKVALDPSEIIYLVDRLLQENWTELEIRQFVGENFYQFIKSN